MERIFAVVVVLLLCVPALGQQRVDNSFHYPIETPAYAPGTGPRIFIDAGHYNAQTAEGNYAPFANLISEDGFQVSQNWERFTTKSLEGVDILVIANALNLVNERNWSLPTPSAFTEAEIEAVKIWVEQGGSLLLIADHMPFPGAASDLAKAFGFELVNGHVFEAETGSDNFIFGEPVRLDLGEAEDLSLPHTNSVRTFSGEAFSIPRSAHSVLTLDGKYVAFLPKTAWKFEDDTPIIDVSGYSQGAIMHFGEGRIAVFGEAAAFSAQISKNGDLMGMNAPGAKDNAGFVLKIIRWLAKR